MLEWNEIDDLAVKTAKVLAADAVEKVGNGHPGTAISLAPAAYLLFQKVMRHDPQDDRWVGRDQVHPLGGSLVTNFVQPVISRWLWPRTQRHSNHCGPGAL